MSVTKIIEKNFMVPVSFNELFFIVLRGTPTHMPDMVAYLIVLALGFAAGYGVREQMSRQRHRRAREQARH